MADTISAAAQRLEQLSVDASASADLLNKFFETCKQASCSSADLTAACTPSTARIFAVANARFGLPAPAIRSLQESPWHLALDTILDFFGPSVAFSREFFRSLHKVSETPGVTWSQAQKHLLAARHRRRNGEKVERVSSARDWTPWDVTTAAKAMTISMEPPKQDQSSAQGRKRRRQRSPSPVCLLLPICHAIIADLPDWNKRRHTLPQAPRPCHQAHRPSRAHQR